MREGKKEQTVKGRDYSGTKGSRQKVKYPHSPDRYLAEMERSIKGKKKKVTE